MLQPHGTGNPRVSAHVTVLIQLCDLSEMQCNSDRREGRCKSDKAIHSLPRVPNEQSHLVIFLLLAQPEYFTPLPSQLSCKIINGKKF